jgi:hypothetical protein
LMPPLATLCPPATLIDKTRYSAFAEPRLIEHLRQREADARVKALEDKKPKDLWDKISAVSGIVAGVIVAAIGFYATQVYDQRSRTAEQLDRGRGVIATELQTVEKFFPHLASTNETERQAAIEAVGDLGNPKLAADIATIFGGPGARAALRNIATAEQGQSKAVVEKALTDLFSEFSNSILRVETKPDAPLRLATTRASPSILLRDE